VRVQRRKVERRLVRSAELRESEGAEEKKLRKVDAAVQRQDVRGVLGNKCTGQSNLKTVQVREIMWK
jgi:hypothetical protein